jgi:hypothetical protein
MTLGAHGMLEALVSKRRVLPATSKSAMILLVLLCGALTSPNQARAANSPPSVTTNPANTTVNSGQTASFTAAASGTPTPTVQWQIKSSGAPSFTDMAGATSTTLSFPNASAAINGLQVRAVFSNSQGTATSSAATLTVNFGPSITTNPSSQTVSPGGTATFTATADGRPTPSEQWQVSTNGGATYGDIAGATSTTLSFVAQTTDSGNLYRAVFTNSVSIVATTGATLNVLQAPVVALNPANTSVTAGQTATFTAAATGVLTPTVQWQSSTNGGVTFNNVAAATSPTLTLSNALASQNGTQYRAVFTNASGAATTTAATLTVNSAPLITLNPSNQIAGVGGTATFTAAASGSPTPTV